MSDNAYKAVPLTCHGHSRPITHLNFTSSVGSDGFYYLSSASKDSVPQLRNGITGDWVGSYVGHKGAVWATKISDTGSLQVTASADFSARVWDATSGEHLSTLEHQHIVRAVALAPGPNPGMVATGGVEKKLRIWDLKDMLASNNPQEEKVPSYEIGAGVHQGAIKSIVWTPSSDLLVSAGDEQIVRWWDMRAPQPTHSFSLDGTFGSLELTTNTADQIICVASGKKVYFFHHTGRLLKTHTLEKDVSCVAINWEEGKFVAGSSKDTWVHIYDYESGQELAICKGHHGPVWSVNFSPDGKVFASGSEDGTIKIWKFCKEPYGMWKGNGNPNANANGVAEVGVPE